MSNQLVKRLLMITDILVETGDTGWANTTRAAAKRITEYDYDLAKAWDEGFADGVNHDLGDRENAPLIINNPYRQEQDA